MNHAQPADTITMARAKLSMAFTDLRGRMGSEVVVLTRAGLATRGRPTYRYPKNANVEQGHARMKSATAVWNELDLDQIQAWQRYAEGLSRRDPVTGKQYSPIAFNAFSGLAMKVVQIDPMATIPAWPPAEDLIPDDMALEVSVIGFGVSGFGHPDGHEELPGTGGLAAKYGPREGDPSSDKPSTPNPTPQTLVPKPQTLTPGVRFTATGANATDTTTEILFQKLPNIRRSPTPFYKSMLFHRFTAAEPTLDVPLEPGVYAFAYRFARPSTGQTTLMLKMGIVVLD